jgi:hypothetical protein
MNLFLTTSDATEQFSEISRLRTRFAILELDRAYDQHISLNGLTLWQGGKRFFCDSKSHIVFFPFRGPNEYCGDVSPIEAAESLELLEDGLALSGAVVHNPPFQWRRSYLKTALLRVSRLYPGLVPHTEVLDGEQSDGLAHRLCNRVVKPGFGIHRTVSGNHPRVTLLGAGQDLIPVTRYRYVIQDYVQAEAEYRCYVTQIRTQFHASGFEMPVGTAERPDWRDTMRADDLRVVPTTDAHLLALSARILRDIELGYVCLDFLRYRSELHLIDINPHGSWKWLPTDPRRLVDEQILTWLESLS